VLRYLSQAGLHALLRSTLSNALALLLLLLTVEVLVWVRSVTGHYI
jgi:hypothetical protein